MENKPDVKFESIPKYRGFGMKNKIARLAWAIAYWSVFRTSVYPFGRYVRVALLKAFGANVAWKSLVYNNATIWAPWNLTMGPRSVLGPHVNCYNPAPIIIGKKVTISQGVYLCGGGHDISQIILPFVCDTIKIDDYVWVCADCFVKYGIAIGEGAVVGCAAVVTHDVAPWTVVGGNPAKVIKQRVLMED